MRRTKIDQEPSGGADAASGGLPVVEIPESDLRNELSVLAVLIAAGLARVHPEAKRLFRDVGVSVNDEPVLSDKAKLCLSDVRDGVIKLGLGKDRYVLLRPV